MVFRDDRDALLAQADALRTQLEQAEADLVAARRVAEDAKAAGIDEDDADEARLRKEIERLRDQVDSLQETNAELRGDVIAVDAAPLPARAPKQAPLPEPKPAPATKPASAPLPAPAPRVEPPLPVLAAKAEVFGSTIRGPAPELPPPGNPAMAFVAVLLILGVVAAFAFLALA